MPITIPKRCEWCKNVLFGKRIDAKYCNIECKQNAYLARHNRLPKQPKEHEVCQRVGCGKEIPERLRSDAKYCSNACRQRVYADKNKDKAKAKHAKKAAARRRLKEMRL